MQLVVALLLTTSTIIQSFDHVSTVFLNFFVVFLQHLQVPKKRVLALTSTLYLIILLACQQAMYC